MFCTCSRSSAHRPPGRQTSRRLQLEQVTSNLRASGWLMKWTFALGLGCRAMTAGMATPSRLLAGGGALRDQVAHALEFGGLVEEIARAELGGKAPVRLGGEVRQHV